MDSRDFSWHNNEKKVPKDSHAIFGASNYHWINYDIEKMIKVYSNQQKKKVGTELHELAALSIRNKVKLPDEKQTLNMYVNDAILLNLHPEKKLYYSDFFYGTADAIGISDEILTIHDLKTGETKASFHQLEVYASYFLLEYDLIPADFEKIELRIYQNNEIRYEEATSEIIVPIMDKIVMANEIIQKIKEAEYV